MRAFHGNKVAEITVKPLILNLAMVPISILIVGGTVTSAMLMPHRIPDGKYDLIWISVGIVILFSLHELVHAFALMYSAKLPWKAFKFGCLWRFLAIYCHCRFPVTMRAQRVCTLAPLITLGLPTLLATIIYPSLWLALVTGVHLSGCAGDIWMYLCSRRFSKHYLYLDFNDKIGGEVFEPPNIDANLESC
jgi:hypothetical protein